MSVNINTTSNEVSVTTSTNNVNVVDNSTNPTTNVNISSETTNVVTVATPGPQGPAGLLFSSGSNLEDVRMITASVISMSNADFSYIDAKGREFGAAYGIIETKTLVVQGTGYMNMLSSSNFFGPKLQIVAGGFPGFGNSNPYLKLTGTQGTGKGYGLHVLLDNQNNASSNDIKNEVYFRVARGETAPMVGGIVLFMVDYDGNVSSSGLFKNSTPSTLGASRHEAAISGSEIITSTISSEDLIRIGAQGTSNGFVVTSTQIYPASGISAQLGINSSGNNFDFVYTNEVNSTDKTLTLTGNVTASNNISSSGEGTGSFGAIVLNYDNLPTSTTNLVKGQLYRDGSDNIKIYNGS